MKRWEARKRRAAGMERAREAGEAWEEDEEDEEGGVGMGMGSDRDDFDDFDDDKGDEGGEGGDGGGGALTEDEKMDRRIKALKVKIEKYEQEERAETVLVVHSGDVGKSVLKKAGIKVNAGRKLKRLAEFDGRAFQQGEADAQEIDLERRAIEAKSG